jgi:oligosaccharide repeat unit polymerase
MIKTIPAYQNIPQKLLDAAYLKREYPIYPMLGLAGTIAGTALAIFLLPEKIATEDALFPSAVIMTIGLLFAPALAILRSPRTIFRAEHILVLSPIYWLLLDLLQKAYVIEEFWRTGVQEAFFGIGLFVSGAWIATLMKPWRLPMPLIKAAEHKLESKTLFMLILVFFSLGITKYAYPCGFNPGVMVSYLFVNRWAAPWTRGALGDWSSFLDQMEYFGYLLPTLTILLILRSKRLNHQIIISSLFSLFFAAFIAQGGNRRIIGVIFGAALICWILEQHKLTIKHLIITVLSITLILASMQTILYYRNSGFQAALNKSEAHESRYHHLHVDDNFYRLSQTITIVPIYRPYVYERQIIWALIRPIPRVFWPNKPIDPGFNLAATIGAEGVALTHSVIGDWYITSGWTAVFIGGWLYGALARMISHLLVKNSGSGRAIVYSLFVMALFAGVRSMIDTILMNYALLAWMVVSWILLPKRRQISHT